MMEPEQELRTILSHYHLGELVDYEKDTRGYVNTSFAIHTLLDGKKSRYFLRRYKPGIQEHELQFEHSLVNHLVARKAPPVARIHRTLEGCTYLRVDSEQPGQPPTFYAIFDFLTGEDRYTWINPKCNEPEVRSSAQVLAQFHQAVSDLEPEGLRVEPNIVEMLPQVEQATQQYLQNPKGTIFDSYLAEHLGMFQASTSKTLAIIADPAHQDMLKLVIHCDYHPGNLKFQNGDAIGLFDFDWSKIDFRCFDFALACFYFFSDWDEPQDGCLLLDSVRMFLESYQETLKKGGVIPPLTEEELRILPAMIEASCLYIINWTVVDYYSKDVDAQEYTIYLKHCFELLKWLNDSTNQKALSELVLTAGQCE